MLRTIADEHRDHGGTDRSIDELAARSGTSRSTVKRALRAASDRSLLTVTERRRPGRKSDTNVITIRSREWAAWLDRRPRRQNGRIGVQDRTATDTYRFSKGLKGNVAAGNTRAERYPHDRGSDRARGCDAL